MAKVVEQNVPAGGAETVTNSIGNLFSMIPMMIIVCIIIIFVMVYIVYKIYKFIKSPGDYSCSPDKCKSCFSNSDFNKEECNSKQ